MPVVDSVSKTITAVHFNLDFTERLFYMSTDVMSEWIKSSIVVTKILKYTSFVYF